MKIKKGDNVIVLAGKDKGKKGRVIAAYPKKDKVVVEGLNLVKRHQRPRRTDEKGKTVDWNMPLHVSNVALLDAQNGKKIRVGTRKKN